MKHLFVARHGNYLRRGGEYRLDDSGVKQMESLGRDIKRILNGESVQIISSTAQRALDSSKILIAQLDLSNFEEVPYLWSGNDAPDDSYYLRPSLERVMGFVNEKKNSVDSLVMVTHLEVAGQFPSYFLKKEMSRNEHIGEILKGQAVHFDLKEGIYQILPR